ncbi:MAG: hypothetical protein K6L76_02965 [Agarilytica sp.]
MENDQGQLLRATITTKSGEVIEDEKIILFVPERKYHKPRIEIRPTREAYKKMSNDWTCSVEAIRGELNDSDYELFIAPEANIIKSSARYWGGTDTECYLELDLEHFQIVRKYPSRKASEKDSGKIHFWVSSCSFLEPIGGRSITAEGEVNYDQKDRPSYLLSGEINIEFKLLFSHRDEDNGDLTIWPYLIGECETPLSSNAIEDINNKYLPLIDDFLLICSFAERRRICCLGWEACDNDHASEYYRGEFAFPKERDKESTIQGVIERTYASEFITQAYKVFSESESKVTMRSALYAAVPVSESVLELKFLRLFSGIESLVLGFRKQNQSEFILNGEDWKKFRSQLKSCLKNSGLEFIDSEQRSFFYKNISGMNRIPLKDVFDKFCRAYDVPLDDLWPVFGDKNRSGLVDIRNKLSHGDPLPQSVYGAMQIASFHLEVVLERMFLRVFGWQVEKSTVNERYLEKVYFPDSNLDNEIDVITHFLKN